jgi:concentrative nucleoside transporter, CNT family
VERLISLFGLLVLLGLAFAFSKNRTRVNWRTVVVGLCLQIFLGVLLLKVPVTARVFRLFSDKVAEFLALADVGGTFVFGNLMDPSQFGFIFAVKVAPTIIFFSAFISVMYYLGVIQILISAIARVMRVLMGTSGAETLSCSANIFVGQTEAPLLIKPYVEKMTASELHAVMIGGFATIAGGVLAAYIGMGVPPNHLIVASVMSAPAALVIAKLLVPETEHSETAGDAKLPKIHVGDNVIDAAARGTTDGMYLAFNVMAMLIAFIALIAVVDWVLGGLDYYIDHRLFGAEGVEIAGQMIYPGIIPESLKKIFGVLLGPIAWAIGAPWRDAAAVGNLLGIKICANEFVAYGELSNLISTFTITERSKIIATYALCGFANFGSIGIQIGGISAIAPSKRTQLAKLGLRAMFGGALASWMTATVAGVLIAVPYEKPFDRMDLAVVHAIQQPEARLLARQVVLKVHQDVLEFNEDPVADLRDTREGTAAPDDLTKVRKERLRVLEDYIREASQFVQEGEWPPAEKFESYLHFYAGVISGKAPVETEMESLREDYAAAIADNQVDEAEWKQLLSSLAGVTAAGR